MVLEAPERPTSPPEAEDLIKEARDRQRRRYRWFVFATVLGVMAGVVLYALLHVPGKPPASHREPTATKNAAQA
jgi:hypothetical protein